MVRKFITYLWVLLLIALMGAGQVLAAPALVNDASSSSTWSATCTISSFNVGTADKLIIMVASEDDTDPVEDPAVSTASCSGETLAESISYKSGAYTQYAGIYYCDNPSGTNNITITFETVQNGIVCGAMSFTDVDDGAPSDTHTHTASSASTTTVTVYPSESDSLFVSVPSHHDGDCSSPCWTPNSGQAKEWDSNGGTQMSSAGGWEVVSGASESHQWTTTGTSGRIASAGAVWGTDVTPSSPYSASTFITDITWSGTEDEYGAGADNWVFTWADDGYQYSGWGDGYGWQVTDCTYTTGTGISYIDGTYDSFTGYDVQLEEDVDCPKTSCATNYASSGIDDWYSFGILAYDDGSSDRLYGVFHNGVATPSGDVRVKYSTDKGCTWTNFGWSLSNGYGAAFSRATFLQAGQNYGDAQDSYVYIYGGNEGPFNTYGNSVYLARAPKSSASIGTQGNWEYWDGSGWDSDIGNRGAVLTWTGKIGVVVTASYNADLARYLLAITWSDSGADWALFEGENPWGPWYEVAVYNDWQSKGGKFHWWGFAPKFWRNNGKDFTLVYGGQGVDNDKAYFRTGSFTITSCLPYQPSISTIAGQSPSPPPTGITTTPAIVSSAYDVDVSCSETHTGSDWEVDTEPGFASPNASSYDDTTINVSWTVTPELDKATTYYVRMRHYNSVGDSAWSSAASFTTELGTTSPPQPGKLYIFSGGTGVGKISTGTGAAGDGEITIDTE
jgi:hypothetical protein